MTNATSATLEPVSPRVKWDAHASPRVGLRRVYMMNLARSLRSPSDALMSWIKDLGFDTLLLSLPAYRGTADIERLPPIVEAAATAGLRATIDLTLHFAGSEAPIVRRHPEWFRPIRRRGADPRDLPIRDGLHELNLDRPAAVEKFTAFYAADLQRWKDIGVSGFRCIPDAKIPPEVWQALIASSPGLHFSVWTPGQSADVVRRLPGGCFDLSYNSLAWWDFGAGWLREELARLHSVAPAANTVGLPIAPPAGEAVRQEAQRLLDVAASNGHGLLLPMGFEFGLPSDLHAASYGADDWARLSSGKLLDLGDTVRRVNGRLADRAAWPAEPEILSGEDAPVAVMFEAPAQLTLANRHLRRTATIDLASVLPMLDGKLTGFIGEADGPIRLAPGEVRVLSGTQANPIVANPVMTKNRKGPGDAGAVRLAAALSRVAIEAVEPNVDDGRFAVKRVVGEEVTVEADIFADGHGKIAAAIQWRAKDETGWRETPMRPIGNDRWSAHFRLERVGAYLFRIIAWPDRFGTWLDEITKKRAAGLDVALELEEGRLLAASIAEAAGGKADLLDDATARAIAEADTRPGFAMTGEMPVDADRRAAEFAAWYELFPRNQTADPSRHGTFRDVIRRLPAIRDMGFDVLYFPPIHPIGVKNRKGRGNSLTPTKDDPGSPYAIGAAEGGHDALHPQLGTLDDFRELRDAAAAHGLELALDFAIQCSPDHPWLREHPEWFDWRPDGGLRYAENPPKKYEDIVNVDFHKPDAIPGLWLALRDIVAFWAVEGVRIFRVDNPHTKPFAFWEWMISDIRGKWPDAIFLAEAFTRPKVMYRLGKLGFTQSYTYFTWRNEKPEIEEYLTELTLTGSEKTDKLTVGRKPGLNVADFYRPNFFVNTPDINPFFLQRSGRAGFLIRAALAATTSGLWGMLQGYELCEAIPIPGREEYADSDKYEIRVRPERTPGDIVDEITRLNAIRRANPALQSHRGLAFHEAKNDRVLWYRKANVDRSNVIFVAVSLDPFAPRSADVEVPLWEWGLPDDAELLVTDLMHGGTASWFGKYRTISLDPRLPFGIWHARPREWF